MINNRQTRLDRFFQEYSLDAILFTNLLNIRYLSGFSGSEGALLVAPDHAWLLCDSRYTIQAAAETSRIEIRQFKDKKQDLISLITEKEFQRVGFESAHVSVAFYADFSDVLPDVQLVAIADELDQIRAVKDSLELETMAAVAKMASDSLQSVIPLIRPGVSEQQLARELEIEMLRRGAEGKSFDFIVASGGRGAMPHGRASEKLLSTGELVTIDFGAVMNGYCSDETVTLALGQPAPQCREIYDIVKTAHDMAIAAVRPGMYCRDLDALARDFIGGRGYGKFFGHGLGHGVGLEIHEKPTVSPRSDTVLQEGMVVTIEPGIYIPDIGGVRIEDTVAVTSDGCRIITCCNKDLIVL